MAIFEDIANAAESTLNNVFAVDSILYVQNSSEVDISGAVAANAQYESLDSQGYPIVFESRDFHIPVANFVAGFGPNALPKAGDTIKETINGIQKQFVVAPVGSLSHYTYQDERQTYILVHSKVIDNNTGA